MFKYNELSDLKDGRLVTPIRREKDNIVCLDTGGNEILCCFDAFDFNKTVEERLFIVEPQEEEPQEEEPQEETNKEKSRWLNDEEKLSILKSLHETVKDVKSVNIYCDVIC